MATVVTSAVACHLRRLPIRALKSVLNSRKRSNVYLTEIAPFSTSASASQTHSVQSSAVTVKPFSDMPSPKGLPIVGTLFQFPWKPSEQRDFFVERCHKYFPIYKETLGAFTSVMLYDMEEIEKLFRNEEKYPSRVEVKVWINYRQATGKALGLLTCDGERWHKMRKVIDKPMLRIKDVSGYTDDVSEVVTDFLERLGEIRHGDGMIPYLERELFNWSLETIGKILYDRRFGGLSSARDPEFQEFVDAIRVMFLTTVQLFVYPSWFTKTVMRSIYNRHANSWNALFKVAKKCVDERMNEIAASKGKGVEKQDGVLSYLLSENSLTVEEIYSNITEMMTGAVDTTSTTVLWMFQELALNPDVQDKLLAEVKSVVPDGKVPTYQDLQKLPYLKAVIKETLRKYPGPFEISRVLNEDRVICGYLVPAKTPIIIHSHVLGCLPQYFKEPDKFKPERWLRGTGEKVKPFSQMAFGFGIRMCVGRRVAELEMNLLLARLIRKFSIEPGFTEPARQSLELVIKPDRPMKIKLKDRK